MNNNHSLVRILGVFIVAFSFDNLYPFLNTLLDIQEGSVLVYSLMLIILITPTIVGLFIFFKPSLLDSIFQSNITESESSISDQDFFNAVIKLFGLYIAFHALMVLIKEFVKISIAQSNKLADEVSLSVEIKAELFSYAAEFGVGLVLLFFSISITHKFFK